MIVMFPAEWTDGGMVEKCASDVIHSPLWPIDLQSFSLFFDIHLPAERR